MVKGIESVLEKAKAEQSVKLECEAAVHQLQFKNKIDHFHFKPAYT